MEGYLKRTVVWYGGVGLLTQQVFRSLALPPKYFRLIVQEIEVMGVRSLGVALTAAVFTGMVFTIQSAVNMGRFGAESYVGPVAALAILRELGPVLTAILVGGKVASGITAELGSMKVTEQIDALRTLGVNYVKRLIVPRLLAAVVVFPLLTVLSDAVGVLGGMIIMNLERGADMYTYWNVTTYWVVPRDFLMGVGKSFFFGGIVTAIVEVNDVWKRFDSLEVLQGLSFEAFKGETLVVMGGSGSGKTVLLRHIAGLIQPDQGQIKVFGQNIEALSEEELLPFRRRMGFVFQGAALFDSLTIHENVAYPLREHMRLSEDEIQGRVVEALARVGLREDVLPLLPSELSGGMRKRVGIARELGGQER